MRASRWTERPTGDAIGQQSRDLVSLRVQQRLAPPIRLGCGSCRILEITVHQDWLGNRRLRKSDCQRRGNHQKAKPCHTTNLLRNQFFS